MGTTPKTLISGLAVVGGIALGEFDVFEGGETTRPSSKSRAPGARFSGTTTGLPDIGNVTLRRDYDGDRDDPLIAQVDQLVDVTANVARIRRDKNMNPASRRVYTAEMIRSAPPQGDTNADDEKPVWELEFTCSNVTG